MGKKLLVGYRDADDLCEQMREKHGGTILLSFSTGKDSLGSWIQCQKFFDRIIPFYLYPAPGLEFIERSLRYYEEVFDTHIIRLPHPSLYRQLNNLVLQAPENCGVIEELARKGKLPMFDYDDIYNIIKEDLGLPYDTYTALGVRAVDSPNRWAAIQKYGPVNDSRRTFYPTYDWRKADLMRAISASGIRLTADYRIFGRSFDGIDVRFSAGLKEHYPEDFERLKRFFPLLDLDILRLEYRKREMERRRMDRLEHGTWKE